MNKKTNTWEENIVLAPPTKLFEEANEIAQRTKSDERFPFALKYDVKQKEFLMSMLHTVNTIVEDDDEEDHMLSTQMNMTQLAFIKRLDCVERIRTNEGNNPFLTEETEKEDDVTAYGQTDAFFAIDNEPFEVTAGVEMMPTQLGVTAQVAAGDDMSDDGITVVSVTASARNACGSGSCSANTSMVTAALISDEGFTDGNICCPGAEQWFKFIPTRTGRYTIYTTGSLDTIGTLYNCCGNKIIEVDDYEPCGKVNFRIIQNLTANMTYYVKVRACGNVTGSYKLRVTKRVLADYVTINKDTITLEKGVLYELPITSHYTYKGYNGARCIPGLSVSLNPSNANEQKILWYKTGSALDCSYGWDQDGDRYIHITAKGNGTAKLYAADWNENGKRDECTVTVVTPYEKQLQDLGGFSSEEVYLIRKLYDEVEAKFASESTILKAWRCARVLSEFCYDYLTTIAGKRINKWDDVAGSVTTEENRQTYFMNTLGYTESEYTKLNTALCRNHEDANNNHNILDFTHMQYALAARLAYTLNKDGIWSNLGSGLYTGNYGIYTDEEISYLAGWLGDAVLTKIYGVGNTSLQNDDYMADLDAENIYRLIIQGNSAIDAINEYYSNMTSSNTRANIFLQHISYNTVKEKIFYELIDARLYKLMLNASNQGDVLMTQYYLNLINDEQYHFDKIKSDYPDTYDFLKSLKDNLLTMIHYQ